MCSAEQRSDTCTIPCNGKRNMMDKQAVAFLVVFRSCLGNCLVAVSRDNEIAMVLRHPREGCHPVEAGKHGNEA